MTYAAELDDRRQEIRATTSQSIVLWPKVAGIGNVVASSATYAIVDAAGVSLGSGSATITDVDGVSKLTATFDASELELGEGYLCTFAWTSSSVPYQTDVRFDVVREPWDGSDVSLNDLRDEYADVSELLEALARAKGTARTAEQEASVVAVRACTEVKGWIRARLAAQGRIFPRLIIQREDLRRVVAAQALARLFLAQGGSLTSPSRQLALEWTTEAKNRLQALGELDYDEDEDGIADARVGGFGSVQLRRGGFGRGVSTSSAGSGSGAIVASSAQGDVVGPASSTDNALARFNGTTGKAIQNSSATVDDSGNLTVSGLINTIDIVDLEARVGVVEGAGVVQGPGVPVTDNAIVRWDGTSGITVRASLATIDDSGNIATSGTVDGRDVATDGAALDAHVAASAPHAGHEQTANKDAANGYAGLSASTKIAGSQQTYGTLANTACEGNDSRLSDSRAPTGSAGGDLTGTYPNPTIANLAITDAKVAAANKDGASGTASMRTLGTGAAQACAGNDSRLSDSRAPSGSASGDLGGTYPSPTVTQARGLRETAGPTTLTLGAVADGQGLVRSGSTVVGQATALGTLTADGDLLTRAASALARLAIGLAGQILRVVSGAPSWGYIFDPRREIAFCTDFLDSAAGTGLTLTNFSATTSFASADRWGIVQHASSATGQASIIGTNAAAYVGGSTGALTYETSFRVPELSDGTDTYTIYIGFGDVTAGGDSTDAIEFRYTHSVASGAWQGVTRNNSSETTATGGSTVTVAASTWYRLTIEVNAAWTSVEFFVDGVSIGTCASNIPTGGSRAFCQLIKVDRTAGTTSRIFAVDYIFLRKAVSR